MRALEHYDNNEFDAALRAFMTVADTSKILFNCAVIHATLGEHTQAVSLHGPIAQLYSILMRFYRFNVINEQSTLINTWR